MVTSAAELSVEVRVTRLRIRLVKVASRHGHQLVCGGRLVSEVKDGVRTPHPDLPEYRPDDFPSNLQSWIDGRNGDVTVTIAGRKKAVGPVRACTLLFTAMPADAVKRWIKGGGQ